MDERVNELCQNYKRLREQILQKYKQALLQNDLLRKNEYTNQELNIELQRLLQTTETFIKANISTIAYDKPFKLKAFWKEINEKIICIDGKATKKVDESTFCRSDFITIQNNTVNAYKNLSDIFSEMEKNISILDSGIQGEERLYNRLKILGDRVRILRNSSYAIDDFVVEHDMIIISRNGIFTVEIKNWKQDSIINERGILMNKYGQKTNIAEQTMRHVHNLEQTLYSMTKVNYNVYPIIAWVNEDSKLDNCFQNLTVCNYNNIEFEILNADKYKDKYGTEEIDRIYGLLKEIQIPAKTFPLEIDRTVLVESIADLITGILFLPDAKEYENDSVNSLLVKIAIGVGGIILGAMGGFKYWLSKDD